MAGYRFFTHFIQYKVQKTISEFQEIILELLFRIQDHWCISPVHHDQLGILGTC